MNLNTPQELLEILKERNNFCIIGHKEPDGDCIGSQLALKLYLERKGKKVTLYSPGPFSRPDIAVHEHLFKQRIPKEILSENPTAVVIDCSTLERIDSLCEDIKHLETLVIDHHASGKAFGTVQYIVPEAPSVTVLIQKIIESSGDIVTAEEALFLFFGLCTDTGFFRHLEENSAAVFSYASRLIEAGASPKDAHRRMYGNKSLASRIYLGKVLSRIESYFEGRILFSYQTIEDKAILADDKPDSDPLYQLLLGTRNCEAAVLLREESPSEYSVGLRAVKDIDVGTIAKSFGGGGHRKASGFCWSGKGQELKAILIKTFSDIL